MAMFLIDKINELRPAMAVYKINFGGSYLIFKGMKLSQSVKSLAEQIGREIINPKEDSMIYKAIAHLRTHPVPYATISVLDWSKDPYSMLVSEYEALNEAKDDPKCLNQTFDNTDYFPKWIPQQDIVKFKSFVAGNSDRFKPSKDVYLRRFLKKFKLLPEDQDKIFDYVRNRYR